MTEGFWRKCTEYVWITKAFYSLLILHLLVHDCDLILNTFLLILVRFIYLFIYFNHMSLEIGSFVVWSVWADQYWHLCFSWTWWQGGELEHQWRLRVLSQRNCCGVVDVGLLEVGGSFMESQVHHLWSCGFMCCWERNETFMHYFATLWYSTQTGRLSRHALSQILLYFPSYQNVFILPLLTHLSYPTGYTTVFFFFFTTLSPTAFFSYHSVT